MFQQFVHSESPIRKDKSTLDALRAELEKSRKQKTVDKKRVDDMKKAREEQQRNNDSLTNLRIELQLLRRQLAVDKKRVEEMKKARLKEAAESGDDAVGDDAVGDDAAGDDAADDDYERTLDALRAELEKSRKQLAIDKKRVDDMKKAREEQQRKNDSLTNSRIELQLLRRQLAADKKRVDDMKKARLEKN